jgi:hypothetical protein
MQVVVQSGDGSCVCNGRREMTGLSNPHWIGSTSMRRSTEKRLLTSYATSANSLLAKRLPIPFLRNQRRGDTWVAYRSSRSNPESKMTGAKHCSTLKHSAGFLQSRPTTSSRTSLQTNLCSGLRRPGLLPLSRFLDEPLDGMSGTRWRANRSGRLSAVDRDHARSRTVRAQFFYCAVCWRRYSLFFICRYACRSSSCN